MVAAIPDPVDWSHDTDVPGLAATVAARRSSRWPSASCSSSRGGCSTAQRRRRADPGRPRPSAAPAADRQRGTGSASLDHRAYAPGRASGSARRSAQGRFVDGEHATSGTARVLELADGTTVLRLEGFSTSDGPDVVVWLTDQPAGGNDWHRYDDGRFVPLGDLKATDGNQNYAVPAGTDLSGLTSVVIWCDRFDVAFGSAPIRSA